ncbi:MAG: hypothetical protein WBP61_05670 [Nocardioides sp.]
MEHSHPMLEAEINRQQIDERLARTRRPRPATSTPRHLLAERLRRVADRVDD